MHLRCFMLFLATTTWISIAACQDIGIAPMPAMAKVTAEMQSLVDANKIAGSTVIVSHRGKIVFFDAVGKRDPDNDLPMQRDTIVRIYSMTKPITSVAAMMLVEANKLRLDDPVHQYLPELKDLKVYAGTDNGQIRLEAPKSAMTVRDLLRHTSGLTYGVFGSSAVDKQYLANNLLNRKTRLTEMINKLGKLPLLHHPSTKFKYSVSTDVLGRVVEIASAMSLGDFFQQRIFKPLKMVDTGFYVADEKLDRFAANCGPSPTGDGLVVIDAPATSEFREPPKLLSGGGGLVSTASDYMRFCQMLLNEGQLDGKRLLREETVAEMTRDQLPASAFPISIGDDFRDGVGFGLGVYVIVKKTDYTALNPIGEYGWGGAASTQFWISPRDDLAVVVLSQHMPYSRQMEVAVRPVIYEAIKTHR